MRSKIKEKEREKLIEENRQVFADAGVEYGHCCCGCGEKTAIAYHTRKNRKQLKNHPNYFLIGHRHGLNGIALENARKQHRNFWLVEGVEYGLCLCGCGETTEIFLRTSHTQHQLKGEPCRFIAGHIGVYHSNKRNKELYEKGYNAAQLRSLRTNYGLTNEQILLMHNDVCAVCNTLLEQTGPRRRALDHCHKTNEVRDFLCASCNTMLGHAQDNPDTLRKAADYLEYHANQAKTKDQTPPSDSPPTKHSIKHTTNEE